ncbi:hypothetical protein L218DRAFT_886367 [Marasmius fiardii PR-910]|nr:hypothetical protein L218DRAFT_886367 [Marasmius fiardii PR-910]
MTSPASHHDLLNPSTSSWHRHHCTQCVASSRLAGSGPVISVAGLAWFFMDRLIVQRLTPLLSLDLSEPRSDTRIDPVAKVMYALKRGLARLQTFYTSLEKANIPKFVKYKPHPRNFPYPNSYKGPDGGPVTFHYVSALQDWFQCCTFLAEEDESREPVVVKFVEAGLYGKDAHKFLGELKPVLAAPKLRYHGPLPTCTIYDIEMVVMDYIKSDNQRSPSSEDYEKVQQILKALYMEGYVFGDMRLLNIIFESDSVKLIDFDWAGVYDEDFKDSHDSKRKDIARYLYRLSTDIDWPECASDLEGMPIIPSDDITILSRLRFVFGS